MLKMGLQEWPQDSLKLSDIPQLQAHRGYCQTGERENTIGAFEAAHEFGFTMCELDVHLSSDRVPVVYHDFDMSHFQDKRKISSVSSQELETMGIPSLAKVLRTTAMKSFNVELKTGWTTHWKFEELVLDTVYSCGAHQRILFSSFSPRTILRLFTLTREIPIAFLVSNWRKAWEIALPFHMVNLMDDALDAQTMVQFNSQKIPVSVWTVNDRLRAQSLLRDGVRSIISDSVTPRQIQGTLN